MVVELTDIGSPELDIFARLTEAQLRSTTESAGGFFIAESPKVIRVALDRGYEPFALLCETRHITGDAADIMERIGDIPVYTGSRELLASLTGYRLTRGVLCAMRRKPLPTLDAVCGRSRLVAVIQSVTDTTNIGAIFRSASALGVDAVVLSSDSCDPLNRRAVRVSMGTVFTVPWTMTAQPVRELSRLGFATAALALSDDSISLDDPVLREQNRLAVVFGTEGDGLPRQTIESADFVVRIPMSHGVDSLNVAAAAAVTFWELRR